MVVVSPDTDNCGPDWLEYDSSCYKKGDSPNGWLGARHHCIWEGGDLVSINSPEEARFVKDTMGKDTPFWLGISNQECNNISCSLKSGYQEMRRSDHHFMTYANWEIQPFQEKNKKAQSSSLARLLLYVSLYTSSPDRIPEVFCAYVVQGARNQYNKWRFGSCGSSLAYLCKRPLSKPACLSSKGGKNASFCVGCPAGRGCSPKSDGYVFEAVLTSQCDNDSFLYNDYCYHYEKVNKSWEDAETFCQARGGHLASMHSEEDGQFLFDHSTSVHWLGHKKMKNSNDWRNSDGTTYDFGREIEDYKLGECTVVLRNGAMGVNQDCSIRLPFFCKKAKCGGPRQLPSLVGLPDWNHKCGWWLDNPYSDFCYLIRRQPMVTWEEAEETCQSFGGNLLSIADSHEQSFIHGIKTLAGIDWMWLGTKSPLHVLSKWTDGSPVSYVKLKKTAQYDCVAFHDNWAHCGCNNQLGYICKRIGQGKGVKQSLASDSANQCAPGWLMYGTSCYKKVEAPNGWLGARHHCLWEGGDLISINSSSEAQFVMKTMGKETPFFWIGLSNLKCDVWCRFEGGKRRLTWSNGLGVDYQNIAKHHPWTLDVSSCAYVNQGGRGQTGMWRSGSCGSSLPYMCKRPLKCPAGKTCSPKGDGYKAVATSDCNDGNFLYGDHCYNYQKIYKSWEEAEKFCLTRGGHLVSVHSKKETRFVFDHARGLIPWLGLRKNHTHEWSDGTVYDYKEWERKQPAKCACPNSWGELTACPCTGERPFVCKTAKLRSFPQLPPLIGQAGWTDKCGWWLDGLSGDFCYLVDHWPKTWQKAEDDCNRLGGNLLSITDLPEQNFLHGYTKALAMEGNASLWLGARTPLYEDDSMWTDKSPWKKIKTVGGDMNSTQRCLSMATGSGDWKVDKCDNKKDYICKKKGVAKKIPSSSPKGVPSANRCALGWLEHGTSCYKKVEAPNGWLGARHHCVWEGGDLVSINSSAEEQFVKDIMGEKTPFWLGLSNQICDDVWCRFKGGSQNLSWSDGQMRSRTNWILNHTEITNVTSCAYVNQGAWSQPGKWRSGSCDSSLDYVCKRPLKCPAGKTCSPKGDGYKAVATSDCNDGNFLYGDHCYNYQKIYKRWEEAERFCVARGGHLASLHSKEEARFVYDHSQSQHSSFVGLKNKTKNAYKWSDGTAFDYKEWEKTTKNTTGECAFPNSVGQLSACPCTKDRPFVCKTAKRRGPQQLPPLVGQLDWTDKCGWWLDNPYIDYCYLLDHQARRTWKQAQDDCQRLGGNLLTIANAYEQAFVHVYIKALAIKPSLWMGATDTKWIDGTRITYSKWSAGRSERMLVGRCRGALRSCLPPGNAKGAKCFTFLTGSGYWKADTCDNQRGYICRKSG
ncbi:secretory phospholipase A2 receptor-like [Syngnathus acus]|uniref:secretory phospholipase A2 receptor-like n=1 Tax=Syngnathus acus TaxID=161584 RepID=UPI001885E741|nr:secretory phospholipase A2 receptor-like [Syngnathus acus]